MFLIKNIEELRKSQGRVKAHTRRSKSGRVSMVKEHSSGRRQSSGSVANQKYVDMDAKLGDKDRKTIGNNTVAQRKSNGDIAIILHQTPVVVIHKDGFTLNSGGYLTSTTKRRINEITGAGVYQKGGKWFLGDETPFRDGIKINSTGRVV